MTAKKTKKNRPGREIGTPECPGKGLMRVRARKSNRRAKRHAGVRGWGVTP